MEAGVAVALQAGGTVQPGRRQRRAGIGPGRCADARTGPSPSGAAGAGAGAGAPLPLAGGALAPR